MTRLESSPGGYSYVFCYWYHLQFMIILIIGENGYKGI